MNSEASSFLIIHLVSRVMGNKEKGLFLISSPKIVSSNSSRLHRPSQENRNANHHIRPKHRKASGMDMHFAFLIVNSYRFVRPRAPFINWSAWGAVHLSSWHSQYTTKIVTGSLMKMIYSKWSASHEYLPLWRQMWLWFPRPWALRAKT